VTAAEFAKLADAATPGPWEIAEGGRQTIISGDGLCFAVNNSQDRDFIAACGTERQRIHRALLLLEKCERIIARYEVSGACTADLVALLREIDAASKEMETRP